MGHTNSVIEMAQFLKDIVRVGKYHVPDGKGGTREVVLTPERLQKWATNFGKQQEAGLRVPAPGHHDFEKAIPVRLGTDGTLKSSTDNLGFWDALWYDPEAQTLRGVVSASGDPNDPKTPAGMIGKSVRETSIYVNPKWKDGVGTEWDEAVMHIACVTHPIQPGQPNFQQVEDGLAVCMSFRNDAATDPSKPSDPNKVLGSEDPTNVTSASNASISEVVQLLRDVAQIALPQDTTTDNIVERLLIALQQKSLTDEDGEGEGSTNEPPEGAQLRNAPFVMANLTQKQLDILTKTVNPETGKPFTREELVTPAAPPEDVVMSHPKVKALEASTSILLTTITDQAKDNLRKRVSGLVQSGRAGKEYVEKHILPLVEGLVMSFGADNKPLKQPADLLVEALEALPVAVSTPAPATPDYHAFLAMSHGGLPTGAREVSGLPHPESNEPATNMTAEQMNGVFARLKAANLLS